MEDLKIVGWTSFDSPYKTEKCSGDKLQAMLDLIFDEIAKNNYVFSGEEHQNELTGVPVFSDGTCFRASMRVWGGIMANMYSGADGEELTYMDFYMSLGSSAQLPAYAPIPVPPAEVAEESFGAVNKADKEMIDQAIELDMDFMTNDKVLQKVFAKRKAEKK